jgi:hypothetical protein
VVLLHEHDDVGDRGCITSACPIQPGSEFSGPRAPANVPAVEFTSPVLHGRPQLSASPAPALCKGCAGPVGPQGQRLRPLTGLPRPTGRVVAAQWATRWPCRPGPAKRPDWAVSAVNAAAVESTAKQGSPSSDGNRFAMQGLSHYPLGSPARNTVLSGSRLQLLLTASEWPSAW